MSDPMSEIRRLLAELDAGQQAGTAHVAGTEHLIVEHVREYLAQPAAALASIPAAIVTTDNRTQCPVCGTFDEIAEVDQTERHNVLSLETGEDGSRIVIAQLGDAYDWEGVGFTCKNCDSPVEFPLPIGNWRR